VRVVAALFAVAGAASARAAAAPRGEASARRAADRELAAALDEVVRGSALAGARTGILVARVESGEVVYAHDPDALLNPASGVKLFTAAAALARFGPEHRFETEFWLDGAPGARPRALHVRGKGDPSMVSERLWATAGELRHAGVRTVREIVIDDEWFDAQRAGPGYDQEEGDRSYLAPTGAVSLNHNAIAIHVAPGDRAGARGRVEVEPDSDYVVIENRTTTGKARSRRRLQIESSLSGGKQRIRVEGRLPLGSRAQVAWRKIDDPAAYFGHTLKRLLEERGVRVLGPVRLGRVPEGAQLVHVAESETVGEVARRLNKHSNNFTAEQLVKALGAHVKGPPGSWSKGIAAIEEYLAEAGIAPGGYQMTNGSGLNDANRFSARQTVALLRETWRRFPVMADFVASLPVAGRDGTIRRRMGGSHAEGMLRAKTGTLQGVTSLAGYVETAAGERLAFAILVNDVRGRSGVVRAVDAIGGALAAAGRPAELEAAVASATEPAEVQEPALALRAHVASYYRVAEAADPANVPQLETALRGEVDPVLRMAAAEAIYLSDPGAEASRRAFLENLALDEASFARLRAASGEVGVEAPVIGSLADLTVAGSPEAAARLVEVAKAAGQDPATAGRYADVLADLSADAPRALLDALRGAPPTAEDAAVHALARGLAARDDGARAAFDAEVARAEAAGGDAAAGARSVTARLAERIATARALRLAPQPSSIGPARTAVR
jgi:D-alanyl-D-alanine carboxypeptidase/D-alanyl-D-alanine-endopeptidase (penicillin-binding protein 4)